MTDKPLAIVTEHLDEACAAWLEQRAEVARGLPDDPGEADRLLARAQALVIRTYTRVDDGLLDRAPRLKVVGRAGVGLDNVDVPACRARGVEVVYTPDANTQAVVEYVVGLILDRYRPRPGMTRGTDAAGFHEMRSRFVGRQLSDLTLGIVGMGRIGKRLGAVAHAIGMALLVNDLLPESDLRAAVDYPFTFTGKDDLYARSDVVTIHVDGRSENRGMLSGMALSHLKSDALLINAARGMLVDHDALSRWLAQVEPTGGWAVLDVHDPEPPAPDLPLYDRGNVTLLPHLASRTDTAMRNMSWVVRDVAAVLAGEPPRHPAPSSALHDPSATA